MVTELATEGKPPQARMLAGLLMKKSLYAKSDSKRTELVARWAQVDEATRSQVKAGCLQTLRSPVTEVRNQACQVISKIGAAELPEGQWMEVIGILKDMVLVALGFICQVSSESLFF